MLFGRLLTAMCTPFTPDGEIDWDAQGALIEHLIQTGTDTIVVSGTTAESPTLSKDEKLALFSFTVKQVAGRVKIIAGVGSNNTVETVQFTRLAAETGVDGVMGVVPYYNKPSQEGIYQHFVAIANATTLPVMLYNVPGRTSANMTAETMIRLSELKNVIAIKEASGNLSQITKVISSVPDDVVVYSGDDSLTLPILAAGGDGIVSVASHLVGLEMKEMIDAYLAGDVQKAAKLHQRYQPVFEGIFLTSSPSPLKYALAKKGLIHPTVRLPLVEMTEDEKQQVDRWFHELVQ
ncbi:4-hydroxy-tetrahydrodipicolinate synthase [Shimazuella sp. AN120528]|uniref:4-hydroxy-tetrahydrodipicolinate synthase n=1 Tax=Shimazuella soli TaxID=1892854 RepID=UPI001F11485D|nr:4-hydroxy-tetrahydrodipicolinate synthase [Shimazuella soli]MCH5586279.1 4-hydroxy-tetrahydrodipicolinate synthase [Shimazuella soli]